MADWPPLPEEAIEERFIASSGPGGQNVNKVATAVQLRLDVFALRLPPPVYARLKVIAGSKWTQDGEIVVTARTHRTQDMNRVEARERLAEMVGKARIAPVRRVKTKPSRSAKQKRMEGKAIRATVKKGRGKIPLD
ncbi:MAG: aminoacyl-tRNA hydrolase [Sphingomonas sanxanigenens]|uniref:Aminoacyl-tRNA hydrolase n=1 Tax=Sphingomonas sanxanigenens TaxID=397260 RepID=A0A2W5A9V9_9SPHN|nr:MAG: aminoacyl-tRNA hydrolase [Sphingomonas sanxanigenens]